MVEANSLIGPDDIVIRRVPPSQPNLVTHYFDERGIERPTSLATRPRRNQETKEYESSLSCSWLKITSPAELLGHLRQLKNPKDPTGWRVCCFRVGDIELLGDGSGGTLKVRHEPELTPPVDLGHCGIYGSDGRACPRSNGVINRLAKIARMLTEEEVANTTAGDVLATSNGLRMDLDDGPEDTTVAGG